MLDNRTVGKTIAALRQANGMTQQKLAATMNVSHQAVSKWETGQALPDMQTMLDLSRLFGVTMEQLLLGDIPEARLHPREEAAEEKKAAPGFDLRSAVQDVVNGIGSLFKAPEAGKQPEEAPAEADAEAKAEAPAEAEKEVPAEEAQAAPDAEAEAPADEAAAEEAEGKTEEKTEPEEPTEDRAVIEKVIEMAPFMSRVALEDMLMQYRGKFTPRDVARLAPFVTSETLEALIWRVDGSLDWDLLRRIAPFLQRDVVDRLTWAYMQGEKAVRPVMESATRAANELSRNVQKKIGEMDFDKLGEQISSGVSQVVRNAQKFGESVAREVNKAFAQPQAKREDAQKKPRSPQAEEARRKVYAKAMDEDKWDWIAERLDALDDEQLKADIAHRAVELGKLDWVEENFADFVTDEAVEKAVQGANWDWLCEHMEQIETARHAEIARAAAAAGAWDFLEENAAFMDLSGCAEEIALAAACAGAEDLLIHLVEEHLTEAEAFAVAEALIDQNREDLLPAVVEHLDADSIDQVCLKLSEAQKWDALTEVMEHADAAMVDAVCLRLAEAGEWERLEEHLDALGEDAIAQLMTVAAEADNWEAVAMLEEYLN